MKKLFSHAEVVELLRKSYRDSDAKNEMAKSMGVTRAFIGDVLAGRRPVGKKIPAYLGLRKCDAAYEKVIR